MDNLEGVYGGDDFVNDVDALADRAGQNPFAFWRGHKMYWDTYLQEYVPEFFPSDWCYPVRPFNMSIVDNDVTTD